MFPLKTDRGNPHPHLPIVGGAVGCAFLLALLWQWFPSLDQVPFGIEGIGQQTVWQSSTFRKILHGRIELFAPAILAGYPIWAEGEAFPLYPLKTAFAVLPPNLALSVTWIVHFLLWFSGMYLLTWTITQSVVGALIAGWVGSFSGPMLGTAVAGHLSQFAAFAWLPWIAWAWMRSIGTTRVAFAGMGSLFLLLSLMAGHPLYTLMALVAAIPAAILGVRGVSWRRKSRRRTLLYGAAFIFFTILAAGGWLLPLHELVSFSIRSGGFDPELLELGSLHLHQIATAVLPHAFGNTVTSPYVGLLTFLETTCFLGIFPALLILAGSSFREPFTRSLWLLALLGIVLASSAVAVPLARQFDLLGAFQLPIRWRMVSWFALSLLCGCGTARLLAGKVSRHRVILAGCILLFLLGYTGYFLFLGDGMQSILVSSTEKLGLGICKGLLLDPEIPEETTVRTLGMEAKNQLARAGLFTVLGSLLLLWIVQGNRKRITGPLLICLGVLLCLYDFAHPLIRSVSWSRCGWPPPLVDYLKSRAEPFRVQPQIPFDWHGNPFPEPYSQAYRNFYRYDMTALDWGALAGVETSTGGFSLHTKAYQGLAPIGSTCLQMPSKDARRKLNVRFVLAPTDALPEGVCPTPLATAEGMGVFEDPGAMPRVSFFSQWWEEPKTGWNELRLVRPGEDAPSSAPAVSRLPDGFAGGTPLPYLREPGPAFHTEVRTKSPGLAVFSELYYPGFEAEIDGRPVPILLAWNALMAVAVPAGEHRITLRYRPRIWLAGAAVSLLGVVGLAVVWWAGHRHDCRTRTTAR